MNHMKYTNRMNYRNDFYMNNKRIKIIKFLIYTTFILWFLASQTSIYVKNYICGFIVYF